MSRFSSDGLLKNHQWKIWANKLKHRSVSNRRLLLEAAETSRRLHQVHLFPNTAPVHTSPEDRSHFAVQRNICMDGEESIYQDRVTAWRLQWSAQCTCRQQLKNVVKLKYHIEQAQRETVLKRNFNDRDLYGDSECRFGRNVSVTANQRAIRLKLT